MQRIGKVGRRKMDQKALAKHKHFVQFGVKEDDIWRAPCQSCGRRMALPLADFSHKKPAGRGGDEGGQVQASNGIASCRPCHEWLEVGPEAKAAREFLLSDPANLTNPLVVQWPVHLLHSLRKWLSNR